MGTRNPEGPRLELQSLLQRPLPAWGLMARRRGPGLRDGKAAEITLFLLLLPEQRLSLKHRPITIYSLRGLSLPRPLPMLLSGLESSCCPGNSIEVQPTPGLHRHLPFTPRKLSPSPRFRVPAGWPRSSCAGFSSSTALLSGEVAFLRAGTALPESAEHRAQTCSFSFVWGFVSCIKTGLKRASQRPGSLENAAREDLGRLGSQTRGRLSPQGTRLPGRARFYRDADRPQSQKYQSSKSFSAQRIAEFKNAATLGSISASRHGS